MKIGASSACFYPLETEKSLKTLGETGFDLAEIFFNAECELRGNIFREIKSIKEYYGMAISSVHPFTSFAETTMLFSPYERRFTDFLDIYKKYFSAAAELGADFIVIHGCKTLLPARDELYFERFKILNDTGKEFGIFAAQENVVDFKSQSPDFLKKMKEFLGDDFKMVLDIKQAVRSELDPLALAEEFKDNIVHLHLSDHTREKACIPPGKGNFDFGKLFHIMEKAGYKGSGVIELYSDGYESLEEIKEAKKHLERLLSR